MSNFILIIFCLSAGIISRKFNWVAKDGFKALNAWVLYFGLPAISFNFLPKLQWDNSLLFTMLGPIIVLSGSILFFYILEKVTKISKRTSHTLMLIAGLSNTSFVGFPLITAYFGVEALPIGIVSDQMTFFLLSTVGVIVAMKGSLKKNKKVDFLFILKRVFTFPPLIGCLLALSLPRIIDLSSLDEFFRILGSTVSPIALFSIGLQLNFAIVKTEVPNIIYALLYKLIIAPGIVALIAIWLGLNGEIPQVSMFEMAMPSLVATSIILSQFKLNSKVGNSVIGLSIPIGLLTTYMWYHLLTTYFL
ncbi:AEC family transporter [Sphingobacterium daejeonense]|uniref:AEC family transporter n=1 Tax=Sphingobacterium daejeonense TaxID=371142 RepID=UPI0021A62C5C|nr:AEC family transporter [Sphingobacterium daejeonense]MCT1529780.1 AEC family transporter [Sphingobacterium daejeonense]